MYLGSDAANFAVLLARVWVGIMIFAHGWRHVKAVRSGPGMANWFESLGLKPGRFHALDGHAHRGRSSRCCSCSGSSPRSTTAASAHSCSWRSSPTTARTASSSAAPRRATSTSPASRCCRSPSAPSGRASGRSTTPSTSPSRSTRRRRCIATAVVGIGGAALFLARVLAAAEEGRPRRLTAAGAEGGAAQWVGSRWTTSRSGSTTSPPSTT